MNDESTPPARVSKGARTKQRILAVALELFSEQGFNGTSVRDIAARAGITHVGLLHHFPNKDDLLVRLLEYREDQDKAALTRHKRFSADDFFSWLVDIVDQNASDPQRIRLFVRLSAEATEAGHPARDYLQRRYALLLDVMTAQFERHFIDAPPSYSFTPRQAAHHTIALMDGLQVQTLLMPGSVDMHDQIRAHLIALGVDVNP